MGYFQVRYDSRVVNYDHRGFIRLTIGLLGCPSSFQRLMESIIKGLENAVVYISKNQIVSPAV